MFWILQVRNTAMQLTDGNGVTRQWDTIFGAKYRAKQFTHQMTDTGLIRYKVTPSLID